MWYLSETFFMAVTKHMLCFGQASHVERKTISLSYIFHLLFHFHFTLILPDFRVIMQLQKMGVTAAPLPMLGVGLTLVSICPRPSTHQHTQACRRGTHAQNNDLSRDSTQSCWMTGDSRARTNSPKIESLLASEWKAFHPHYPPKSSQVTLNRHKKIWAFDESVSFFFCSLIRGLFASHYTETHYMEDGSAVTNAHNFTVRWLLSDCDIYSQVDVRWYTAANTVKTDPLKMGT